MDDDATVAVRPDSESAQKHQCSNTRSNGTRNKMPCSTSRIATRVPRGSYRQPEIEEIARPWAGRGAGTIVIKHTFTEATTTGRPAGTRRVPIKKHWTAEFTAHFDPEWEDLCPVENHGQDGVGHFQFI